ncbi:MAG: hypothetical protein H7Y18_08270 [Clostridiaceae bacterium]|nr:hypothetical protein [Clostridiaceae bacterium]
MFGYVTACKMELKIKDFEKYKAYYCGVCKAIKVNFGNLPRLALNYDMTFLAILLDSFEESSCKYVRQRCIAHPVKKRVVIIENSSLDYAAFCNVALVYYKLLDNVKDDNSAKSKVYSFFLKNYLKGSKVELIPTMQFIEKSLNQLSFLESEPKGKTLDEFCDPFAELTAFIISSFYKDKEFYEDLYKVGYNLGKWIYLIDALDDLEKDMKEKKFNAIDKSFNEDDLPYEEFYKKIENRIDFVLVACAAKCDESLKGLPIKKNLDILNNILKYGLMEKMDKVFRRSQCKNE